jgi:hypothetical protein
LASGRKWGWKTAEDTQEGSGGKGDFREHTQEGRGRKTVEDAQEVSWWHLLMLSVLGIHT